MNERARFEADLVHQTAAGIDTRLLTPEEAHEIVPQLAVDDLCSPARLLDARASEPPRPTIVGAI